MRIRPATPADVALIHRFIRDLARYERLEDLVVATEESLRETLFGARRYAEVIIAEDEGRPVGFALFFHNYSTFLGQPGIYLEDLFVEPDARGRGYGKALLIELARIATERGCGRVEWAVLNWNTPAIDFYESLGAKPQTEWQVYRVTGEALAKLAGAISPGS
ncbi:MAG TPA: GNAT family N-acetyltransferase [Thermoanaerobaculia bacterium]|nr:GNAT family N-acetyltransferase [Thermoanaerobaculia bacterium]